MEKAIRIEEGKLRISKRQLKVRLISIIIIIAVSYAFGEALVRLAAPQQLYNKHVPYHPVYPKEVEYDQDLGWATVKNYRVQPYTKQGRNSIVTITHNSQGYRMNHEVNESKRIIVMTGDSLVYGFWVDDKKIVSSRLNEILGNDYEVVNLGVGGYGTDQAFLRSIRDGAQYKPKAVVHVLFANDFSNIVSQYQYNVFKPLFTIEENQLTLTNVPVPISKDMELSYPKKKDHAFKGFERLMRSWSHFYVLYKSKISALKTQIKSVFKNPEKQDYFNAYKDGELWSIEKNYSDLMKYSFYLNSLILNAYSDYAKENNATFVLVVIGDRISVDPEMQKATVESYYNIDSSFFDYDKPYLLLEEFAKSNGIAIVNLYPVFKQEYRQNKKSVYLEGDHHLNDYGHELFAKELYNKLVEINVVEK